MAIDPKDGNTGFITADGKNLEWKWFGASESNPVIVMLHEGLGAVALWRDFPARLAQATGCGVLAYSRAGYGQSDPAELPKAPYNMSHEATVVLPQILDAIGTDTGFILLGHSDGATIAAEYTGRVADHRIRGLILMAPHFFTEQKGLDEIKKAREVFESGDMKTRMAKYHRDPVATFRGWNDNWLDTEFADWNVAEVIDYFRIPVLAIQGRDDQYGTLAQIDEVSQRSYAPVDVCILDDCNHSPHLDQPEKTLEAIAEYTARLMRIENTRVRTG